MQDKNALFDQQKLDFETNSRKVLKNNKTKKGLKNSFQANQLEKVSPY